MNELALKQEGNGRQRKYSEEAKRSYCIAWESSGLTQIAFCKAQGISKSAFRQWYKAYKQGGSQFVALGMKNELSLGGEENLRVEVCFSNEIRLAMAIHPCQLRGLIQEISHAASIIR